jgi:hypothetical protein
MKLFCVLLCLLWFKKMYTSTQKAVYLQLQVNGFLLSDLSAF